MIYDELLKISFELQERANCQNDMKDLDILENVIHEFGKSWSGSNIGFHANIYYKDFSIPPANANFSIEWGTLESLKVPLANGENLQKTTLGKVFIK